jgi:hypothetical protein
MKSKKEISELKQNEIIQLLQWIAELNDVINNINSFYSLFKHFDYVKKPELGDIIKLTDAMKYKIGVLFSEKYIFDKSMEKNEQKKNNSEVNK